MSNDTLTQPRQSPSGEPSKKIESPSVEPTKYKPDILKSQYEIAIDLYKHEDNLNWKKLYNLFYVSGALLFILGFISESIETFPNDIDPSILGIISLVGALISLSFAITIWCGVKYLLRRKEKVKEIEQELKVFGGLSIVGGDDSKHQQREHKRDIFDVSPTTIILRVIPILFTLGWFLLLCYSLVKLL